MQKNILSYIWEYSRKHQLVIVALTCLSFPILYMTLELPKWIINDALTDKSPVKTLFGFEFQPVPFLVVLCVALLVLIVLNGVLKMRINTFKGIIGERMVRRLRFSLIERTLRFPLSHFSKISSGEMISTVTAETEPLAGYIGESVALPLFQGGTMITILIFMFAQDWVFGLVSVALIPVQGYLIPKLQKQVNRLKKERVRRVRKLSERIGETVSGAQEIRLQGTEAYTLSEFSQRFGDLFWVRLEIFKKKFFMKFLNNTIGQITPFLFYLFGGYLVLKGDLTIGALVASLAAYKDLTSPWKELLNHYQAHEDAKIKYEQIIELFNPDGLVELNLSQADTRPHLNGDVSLERVSWVNENAERVLSGISIDIPAGSTVAITGEFGVRRARLARLLTGLDQPTTGSVKFDGELISDIPNSVFRTRLGYLGPNPHIFAGTIQENIRYGLNMRAPDIDIDGDDDLRRQYDEAIASGNSAEFYAGEWDDHRIPDLPADGESEEAWANWYRQVSVAIGSEGIVYQRSLLEIFDPQERPELAASLLECRQRLNRRILEEGLEHVVSSFDPDVYNLNATVAENILFGVPVDERLAGDALSRNAHLIAVLDDLGLRERAIEGGATVFTRLAEMMTDLPADSLLLAHFDLEDDERVEFLTQVVDRYNESRPLKKDQSAALLAVFLQVSPERHGFAEFDFRLVTQLLQARRDFAENLPDDLRGAIDRFDQKEYHRALTVEDNMLYGRVASGDPEARRTIDKLIAEVVDEVGVRTALMFLLSESQVGISGSRLPEVAKHRIPLGRILAKKPDVIVFHDALSPLDHEGRAELRDNIRILLPSVTIIWISERVENPDQFDQVYEFTEAGPLVALGEAKNHNQLEMVEPVAQRTSDPFALISHSTLFSPLKANQHRYLADHSRVIEIPEDKWIYRTGDEADACWLIVSGSTSSWRPGQSEPVGNLGRLEVFGALEVLAGRDRLLSVRTETPVKLIRIDGGAIDDIAGGDPEVSRGLLRALTDQWAGPSSRK